MTRYILLPALLMGALAVHAETNVCTSITSLPAAITQPGQYCLQGDLSIDNAQPAGTWAIQVQANDVVIDCNDHSITGPTPDPTGLTKLNTNGIRMEGSQRTTVRHCRTNGFDQAIRAGITLSNPASVPSDIVVEDNRIVGATFGLSGTGKGTVRILRNTVMNGPGQGIAMGVRDGVQEIRDNYVSRLGDPGIEGSWGTALVVSNSGTNTMSFVSGNTIGETVSGPGDVRWGAVIFNTGARVDFSENVIMAPSNPASMTQVPYGVQDWGATEAICHGNVIVGYGGEGNNLPCAASNNRIY